MSIADLHHSPADLGAHLRDLEAERALALLEGLGEDGAYMEDLRDEIEGCRAAYVGSAVTEIASLRGALGGRRRG
jgi:hypothetical protein